MAYYSKYTGKELEERLDRIKDIPTLINKLFLDKEYLTELDVKCLIKEMIPTFYEGIPIDNKTIYWENGVLKSLGTGEGGGGCDCPELWEVKEANGQQYLYSRLPIATQGGITMYANSGSINIPSIYAGIPVDGTTITKREDGTLMVNPNIELGGASNWDELEGKPSWITNSKPKYNYNEIEDVPDLSKYALNEDIENLVTLNTDQVISGYKNFEKGLAINGLSITNTKDDIVYLDANLIVRGGIVMYADDTVDVPNLIDSLPKASYEVPGLAAFDSTYFVVDTNGKVTLIPDNVGLNEEQLNNYLSTNNYAKKSDIPSLNGYATQSWVTSQGYALSSDLTALSTKFSDFLEGSDTDTIINKWKELESFLSGLSESDNLATILGTKADRTYVDTEFAKYVTLATAQSISGEKNFTGGLKVNGSPIVYDATNKYWKLEGDLLVTGGVTMYGSDSSFTPSTIMDAIAVDGITISKDGGVLKVIGDLGGGATTLGGLSNVGTWADSVADVDRIMYQAAGSSMWVAKSLSSIGGGVSGDYLPLSGGTLSAEGVPLIINSTASYASGINFAVSTTEKGHVGWWNRLGVRLQNNANQAGLAIGDDGTPMYYSNNASTTNDIKTLLHAGNYSSYALPLSGGTINGAWALDIKRSDGNYSSLITFSNTNGTLGYVGFTPDKRLAVWSDLNQSEYTIWHNGNDGSGSGLDADLLDGLDSSMYARYIGSDATFDLNVIRNGVRAGKLFNATNAAPNGSNYRGFLEYGTNGYTAQFNSDNLNNLYYRWCENGTWKDWRTIAFIDSNVASAAKLQTARTIWGQSFDGTKNVSGDINGVTNLYFAGLGTDGIRLGLYGNPQLGKSSLDWTVYSWDSKALMQVVPGGRVIIPTATTGDGIPALHVTSKTTNVSWNYLASFLIPSNGIGNKTVVTLGVEHSIGNCAVIYYYNAGNNNDNNYLGFGHYGENDILTVSKKGNVGIGTTIPAYPLDVNGSQRVYSSAQAVYKAFVIGQGVYGSSGFYSSDIRFEGDVPDRGGVIRCTLDGSYATFDSFSFYSADVSYYKLLAKLDGSGNILATGGITMYSDQRKKTILNHVELSLKQIANAPLVEHYYNGDDKKTIHVGSIAQYWAKMNDWFCKLDNEGYYTMEIQNAALASAISVARELDRYETKTDKKIKQLKKRICQLEDELERLKSA